ncbi:MAG: AMP-binding protein [Alphaproteobacteria bacterium]|nr:AMP-binding protein [Alphaproteobacteria bacterium]
MNGRSASGFDAAAEAYRAAGFWRGELVVDHFDRQADANPKKTALIAADRRVSYGALQWQSRNLAANLLSLNITAGDVVAIQAPNWIELALCHLALDRIGAIFLPLHDGFREAEMAHLLRLSEAKALIHPAIYRGFDHRELVRELRADLPSLRQTIIMREQAERGEISFDALTADDAWLAKHGPDHLASFRPDSTAPMQIMVSSGTTAMPRCTIYCDDATVCKLVGQYGAEVAHLGPDDIAAAIAPAGTGATGYSYPILAPLMHGGTAVLLERWDGERPEDALALIAREQCTYAVMIPTQLIKLLSLPDIEAHDLSALRFVTNAGAKLPDSVAEQAERRLGCVMQTIYGASDAGVPTMTSVDDALDKRRTVGRVLPGQQLRLADDDGQEVEAGQPGEVLWRGANQSYGFFNAPEETAMVWDEAGWYHSGDLGQLDGEGYLSIVGRKKDMIIRGGRNINPRQIEEVLLRHDLVTDAAVIPFEDPVLGEIACAVIVRAQPNVTPALDDLNAFIIEQGLAVWCQPERLMAVDDFPRNAGGKIDKQTLITQLQTS